MITNYKERNCVIFGANSFFGKGISEFLSQKHANLGLIDLNSYKDATIVDNIKNSQNKVIYKTVASGDKDDFRRAVEEINSYLCGIDCLICSYYIEEVKKKIDPEDLSIEKWDKLFQEWILSYFLVAKATVPLMIQKNGGRIVFVNTTTGYTGEGEGEITVDGSIHENACSSGITGMMTSIARDVIPQGVSVNGIALGPKYEKDLERIIWATHLWLSGMAEYSCAQIIRLY
jgi:NAD(P)-dependent dehydrogenase (short-subunit alcohol dehydrogenase family)